MMAEPSLESLVEMKRVLSLGAGVQSSCLALMASEGLTDRLDAAVFADTGWEPKAVYEWLDELSEILSGRGIPVYRVSSGNIKNDAMRSQFVGRGSRQGRYASMPYFFLGPNGEQGQIKRQCTSEYKIEPIRKWLKYEFMGYKKYERIKGVVVESWRGISVDELCRAKPDRESWIFARFPLIEMRMNRNNCVEWLKRRGYGKVPRSACIACPYRRNHEWKWLRDNSPEEWQEAVEFDAAIRKSGAGMRGEVFVHDSRLPLACVNLDGDTRQMNLWDDECEGMCGV